MEPSTRRHCEFVTIGARGRFTDIGPDDHGALFDLAFPEIDPCEPVTFTLSYQAGTSSAMAKDALDLVDADAWSLAEPGVQNGASTGEPNTFAFGLRFNRPVATLTQHLDSRTSAPPPARNDGVARQ